MIDRHKHHQNRSTDREYGRKLKTPVGIIEPVLIHLNLSALGMLNIIYRRCHVGSNYGQGGVPISGV
jgi:hypothetical protein